MLAIEVVAELKFSNDFLVVLREKRKRVTNLLGRAMRKPVVGEIRYGASETAGRRYGRRNFNIRPSIGVRDTNTRRTRTIFILATRRLTTTIRLTDIYLFEFYQILLCLH